MTNIAGVDLSLVSTGLARVTHGAGRWVADTSTIPTKGHRDDTLQQRHDRIRRIGDKVRDWCRNADLVVVEGPSHGSRGGSPVDRYGLWWRVVGRLLDAELPVAVVAPTTRAKFAAGKGNADKAAVAVAAARIWPDAEITGSDEADALVLASIGACLLGLPVLFDLPKYRTDALAAVQRPAPLEAIA
ncbi:hypothetical protein ACWEV3_40890 [Saccharopolyspora sp. NPDC003752]